MWARISSLPCYSLCEDRRRRCSLPCCFGKMSRDWQPQGQAQCPSWMAGDEPAWTVGLVPRAVLSQGACSQLVSFLLDFHSKGWIWLSWCLQRAKTEPVSLPSMTVSATTSVKVPAPQPHQLWVVSLRYVHGWGGSRCPWCLLPDSPQQRAKRLILLWSSQKFWR